MSAIYVMSAEEWAEVAADMEAIAADEEARRAADTQALEAMDAWVDEQFSHDGRQAA